MLKLVVVVTRQSGSL